MRLRLIFAVLTALFLSMGLALAQDGNAPDYEAWDRTASRAEAAIDAEAASDPAFETLRGELVEWRSRFQDATGLNAARIETLRAQIEALGPAPAEGESEPAEIAAQRSELNTRLAEAQAPSRRAEAELLRARGLIGEIDELLAAQGMAREAADGEVERALEVAAPEGLGAEVDVAKFSHGASSRQSR